MLAIEQRREEVEVVAIQRDIRNHTAFLEKSLAMMNDEINRTVRCSSNWR
jgi:hypothetical protein